MVAFGGVFDFSFYDSKSPIITKGRGTCVWLGELAKISASHVQVAPLAAAFVGYVVFWNLSLQMNTVGFYQLSKIMVLPSVAGLEVSLLLSYDSSIKW